MDRSQRTSFEERADLYDEVRSGYPDTLVKDVLSLSGIPATGRMLEIGCGPGNATVAFAKRGYRLLGLELGERLAALAARNCRAYPGTEIRHCAFEDWALEERTFDLAISADAFHWIPPDVGYPKVAKALKDSGSVAFFWNVPVDPQTEWSRAIDKVYGETAPHVGNPDKAFTAEWLVSITMEQFDASRCFDAVTVLHYAWSETLTTEHYLKLLRTFSIHRSLDEDTRSKLYAGIRDILQQFGGRVVKPHAAVLFHARVKR